MRRHEAAVMDSFKKEVRRQARQLDRELLSLEALKKHLVATFSDDDFEAMCEGRRPLSPEALLVALLQRAVVEIEEVAVELRNGARADVLRDLVRSWRGKGDVDPLKIRAIRTARKSHPANATGLAASEPTRE
jgi:hypothetical protein